MKLSQLFGQTLRETPNDAEVASHILLVRAGFIRPLGAGIFTSLHLAKRSMMKIENIIRDEMEKIGGQEISMPVVHPADLWKQTGRWHQIGTEMGRFKDKNNHDMVLAMTHEEVVADLARREIQSRKQLPRLIYHIQTKWRDDPRPRGGLLRVREFTMKDSYSLDADWDGLDRQYRAHYQAYHNIFHRCGLNVVAIKSDTGMMGGKLAHEFMYLTPIGEDTILICNACGYTANRQVANFKKTHSNPEELRGIEKVFTPGCKSIDDLASLLKINRANTAKAVFFVASLVQENTMVEKFVFAIVRGDMEVNETKLTNTIGASEIRPATDREIQEVGMVPGYASPIGSGGKPLEIENGLIVLDDSIKDSPNLVGGANEVDHHFLNTNYPRDYQADMVADIVSAYEGASCPVCSSPLSLSRGVELGNIFKLGTRYSDALGCTFLDQDGSQKPIIMGSYGIGIGRLLACIAEEHHDQFGLMLPVTVAPYQVHLILLRGKGIPQSGEIADGLYHDLVGSGVEVLFDDRDESPGVKFNDADLIGLPVRITLSERSIAQGGLEMKMRHRPDKIILPLEGVVPHLKSILDGMMAEINLKITGVEFK